MNKFRRSEAWRVRAEANDLANQRPHPKHIANADEQKFRHTEESKKCHTVHHKPVKKDADKKVYSTEGQGKITNIVGLPSYLMSFTKGMPHNLDTGLLADPIHYKYFVRAIDSGNPRDFRDTPLGPQGAIGEAWGCDSPAIEYWLSHIAKNNGDPVAVRSWESQSAGLSFDLQGPDAQAVTMPPHPELGSDELTAEMAEVYAQALLRDVPFHAMSAGVVGTHAIDENDFGTTSTFINTVKKHTDELAKLDWFSKTACELCLDGSEKNRHRGIPKLNPGNAFRGITRGDDIGPYLSQFLLIGDAGLGNERGPECGLISYGSINIDQRVRTATAKVDYMTTWEEWFDVQNGADLRGLETYVNVAEADKKKCGNTGRRFMTTPRDLATYVHYDALYEAYLNACLLMLSNNVPFDPGIPFQEDDNRDHQQGFAHFGGPHILSLVTEVATRALKAVRFQKYNVHRRCRPEVLAARLSASDHLSDMAPELGPMKTKLKKLLGHVKAHNTAQNKGKKHVDHLSKNHHLLPMAFAEGSPMHPAYGAGHATVAGACVTILKAFFDCKHIFSPVPNDPNRAYVANTDGSALVSVPIHDQNGNTTHLTIEGELNKLASNIAIGRDWAGVHYFTDYYESILMGEQIAIGILEEQKLTFGENFSMTLPLFGGGTIRI